MTTFLPVAASLLLSVQTGVWDGYSGTRKVSSGHQTEIGCIYALKALGPGTYSCRTITKVFVTEGPAGTVSLQWTPPTQNTNGTPLTNLKGYEILYGATPETLNLTINLESTTSSYVLEGLAVGPWYFSLKSVNTEGVKSSPSNVTSKVIQ